MILMRFRSSVDAGDAIASDILAPLEFPAIDASGLTFAASHAYRLSLITLDLSRGERSKQSTAWLRVEPTCLALHSAQPVAERTPRRIGTTVMTKRHLEKPRIFNKILIVLIVEVRSFCANVEILLPFLVSTLREDKG